MRQPSGPLQRGIAIRGVVVGAVVLSVRGRVLARDVGDARSDARRERSVRRVLLGIIAGIPSGNG